MKWEKQIGPSCLGYALWSIGALTEDERNEYRDHVAPYLQSAEEQLQWVRDTVPWAAPVIRILGHNQMAAAEAASPVIPSRGTGVLTLRRIATIPGDTDGNHAMAYASGKVLDPDGHGRLETWEEYSARVLREHGWRVILLATTPKKRSRKA